MNKFYAVLLAVISSFNFVSAQSHCFAPEGSLPVVSRGVETLPSAAHMAREEQYDVKFYFLDLGIERSGSFITGNALTRGQVVVANMDTFALELDPVFTIDSVHARLNNSGFQNVTTVRGTGTDVNVLLPFTAQLNDNVEVRVFYHGTASTSPNGSPTGAGYFTGNNGGNSHAFSASPPYNSSTWWPCKQNLADKADSSWFFITTDTSNTAISNGLLSRKVDAGAGKNRWEWKSRYPINFYVICFTVGKYARTEQYFHPTGRTDSMLVEYYGVSAGYTLDALQKFSDHFGLYPFYEERFALAGVTLGGGIENQTFVSYGPAPNVVEHEIAHQWFGDNVTCNSYKDVWLNEGFARWAESMYVELNSGNPNTARIGFCNQYESGSIYSSLGALGYPNGSIYNSGVDTNNFIALYGGLGRAMNYEKPAMMINMLRYEIGNDSLFFRCLRNYQDQFSGRNATGNDFWDIVETTTDRDFSDFFNQWYLGYGHPFFNIKWNQKSDTLSFEVTETTSNANTSLFKVKLQLTVKQLRNGLAADTLITIPINQNISGFRMLTGDSVTGFVVDPNQWVLNKAGTIAKDTALVIIPTGIEHLENKNEAYSVYPNPASGYLNIRCNMPGNEMINAELYNALGQRVQSERLYPNEPMKLNALPEGMYVLFVNRTFSYKISIAH